MSAEPPDQEQLDFLSFVDYAIDKTTAELPQVDPVAMRFVLTLHRATNALVYDLESTVHRPNGWSWPGFRVLFVLWLAGPLEAKRIAELSGMSRAAVSSLVKTLERDELITRERATHDRRALQLTLTQRGHGIVTSAFTEHNKREQAWAEALTRAELTVLIGLLEKLMHGAQATESKRRS